MRSIILIYSLLQLTWLLPKAQPDSLSYILEHLQSEVSDEQLRQALQEVNALYRDNAMNDSLSIKLLAVSDLLTKRSIDKRKTLSYNLALTERLRRISPEGGHIQYAYSLDHLARSYQRISKYEEALQIYQKALSIKARILGEDHIDVASGLENLGDVYFNMRRYDKALPLYRRELIIKEKKLGETSYEYVDCLISLGWAYNYLGHYDTALQMSQKVLILIKNIPKTNSVDHANSLMNIARLYHRMGQYDRSLALYEQALAMRKEKFGEDHFEYAVALIDVGYFYHRIIGNYEKALLLYGDALLIIEKISEKNDAEKTRIGERLSSMHRLNLMHLGTVNYLLKDYEKAVSFYERVLQLSPSNITYMGNLALALFSKGQNGESISLCHEISKILIGQKQGDLEYANGSRSLALLYYEMGKYDSALPFFENYARITRELWGKDNLDYASGLNDLGMVHAALGDTLAASFFDEATNITLNHLSRTYATLSEQEKIGILRQQSYQFDYLPSLLFFRNQAKSPVTNRLYENILALKGMVLEDQQAVLSS
ncbi:MAG TPA: tetratricopeptide repeat protein, partial [Flavitalea sp.]|nr:tetratricopeptide repeat protein [Flavitalea sp.]